MTRFQLWTYLGIGMCFYIAGKSGGMLENPFVAGPLIILAGFIEVWRQERGA